MSEDGKDTGKNEHYTQKRWEVIAAEKDYIRERRQKSRLGLRKTEQEPAGKNLWGMSLSGGGIRSATFALGVVQELTRRGVMKRVDYLSTVSGGGYFGSCLTSLLTNVDYKNASDPDDATSVPKKDSPSQADVMGMDSENSPFVGLNQIADYTKAGYERPDETEMSVRHQIHHLRSHGEYLAPRGKGILDRDVQRAIGSTMTGISLHFLLFFLLLTAVVCVSHIVTAPLDLPSGMLVSEGNWEKDQQEMPLSTHLSVWWSEVMFDFRNFANIPDDGRGWLWGIAGLAAYLVFGFLWYFLRLGRRPFKEPTSDVEVNSGFTWEDTWEWVFTRKFNLQTVLWCLIPVWIIAMVCVWRKSYLPPLLVYWPLAFAVGGCLASMRPNKKARGTYSEIGCRSLVNIIQGGAVYGMVAAAVGPLAIVMIFSFSHLSWAKLIGAIVSFFLARKAQLFASSSMPTVLKKLLGRFVPVIALAFGLLMALSLISGLLIDHVYAWEPIRILDDHTGNALLLALVVGGIALVSLWRLGLKVNSNHVSPHYFYRDRLAEAYLRTTARVERARNDRQGRPLITLRDDEKLELQHLGENNGRGPYHLIVTALNLAGSSELNRKTMLSDHFIFSREYCGSDITGYVKTKDYRGGRTKLARAMSISAAAAGSASGFHTTGWNAFLLTLFNVRLGYWMENPWYYRDSIDPAEFRKETFWPKYLGIELSNGTTAKEPLVNLSDGGHTGDNLGLLPLLHRRCRLIIVSDAEADPDHVFESLNNAIRMAFIEENIEVLIPDLKNIRKREEENDLDNLREEQQCFAIGEIHYPEKSSHKGTLIYLKASLSDGIPEHIRNYARMNSAFPHQTTGDQFFDDAQFEAYRALGEHTAKSMVDHVSRSGRGRMIRTETSLWKRMVECISDQVEK